MREWERDGEGNTEGRKVHTKEYQQRKWRGISLIKDKKKHIDLHICIQAINIQPIPYSA